MTWNISEKKNADAQNSSENGIQETWFHLSDVYLTAFIVPILIMILIFVQRGIFPFGENSFLRTDMYHQYAPFFSEFQYKLEHGGSLLYSWDVGLGVNFSALYAYYLASPFNWLIVFCPKEHIIEFMGYMIVFKIGLSGLSMAYYLKHHASGKKNYFIAFFGIFYALSAYMAAYSWNIMWLDCMWLFPLVCLGLERLVNRGKGFLYAVTLGLCITSNYYISIMICMFMVIYFAALLVLKGSTKVSTFLSTAGKFAFFSVMAAGVSAAVLLPEIFALQTTASKDINFPQTFTSYFSIIDMLARHMGNIDCEIGLDNWPNIYCGVAVYLLVLLYIANRKIRFREKAVYITILMFFLASFSIDVLNYIWHGLHYPNSLPCRQSFIYIFLVLYISFRACDNFIGNTVKHIAIAFFGSFSFILLCQKLVTQKHFTFGVYYAAMGLVAFYALMLYLNKTGKIKYVPLMYVLLAVVSVEAAANTTITSVITTSRTAYMDDNKDVIKLTQGLGDNPFSRFEKVTRKSKDDGAWMNFHSVSLFSSTASADLSTFFRQIGCESSVNAYGITGSTPLADSLFDVRYGIYSETPDNDRLEFIGRSGKTRLYENPSTFPLCYLVSPDFDENWVRNLENPADVQNDLCSLMGTDPVLIQVNGTTDGNRFSFNADEDGQYYVFITNARVEKATAHLPEKNKTFEDLDRRYFLELGALKANDSAFILGDAADQTLNAKAYRFDYDALEKLKQKFASNPMEITSMTDTHISGTVNADKMSSMMTSIPYDKGWTVKLDGEKISTRKYLGAFLSFNVPEGAHTVEMDYEPQGYRIGMLISFLSILLLAVIALAAFILRGGRHSGNRTPGRKEEVIPTAEEAVSEEAASEEAVSEEAASEEAASEEKQEIPEPAGVNHSDPYGENFKAFLI
jgi:uncharacterized membrane protein YfhO